MAVLKKSPPFTVLFLLLALLPVTGHAAEPDDEETDFPITIEDATAADPGTVDARFATRYEHLRDGENALRLDPEIEYGVVKNLEPNVTLPFFPGSDNDDHGGDLGLEALYSFVEEQDMSPELAASFRVDLPTGENSKGVDTVARFLATKHILPQYGQQAVHFNASWSHNAEAMDDERDNYYQFAAGASRQLSDKLALIADVVHDQQKDAGETHELVEAGMRYALTDKSVVGFGIGTGLSQDSPDAIVTCGFQQDF